MKKLNLAEVSSSNPDIPYYVIASSTDLALIRSNETDEVFVLYGRCQHRGALMSDGRVTGEGGMLDALYLRNRLTIEVFEIFRS